MESNSNGSSETAPQADSARASESIPLAPAEHSTANAHEAEFPVARPANEPTTHRARIPKPSVLVSNDEKCPKCGGRLQPEAVICFMCGYDLKANRVRTPEIGVEESEVQPVDRPVFVPAKPEVTKTLLITGGVLMVLGMALAGVTAASVGGAGYVLARVVLVAYLVLLHTATGAAAVIAAAWLTDRRLGSLEQATVRMLVTVASLLLVLQVPDLGLHAWLAGGVRWLLAAGVYFLVLLALFRKNRQETGILAGAHAVLWLLTTLGMQLVLWVNSTQPMAGP
ncbi:MAG: zinc ribbon domain-containing protein [Phycisphaeraceae bacterium]|nr:zinc ribbon domain-containing protein [Phycisphaeraceae bacterium]